MGTLQEREENDLWIAQFPGEQFSVKREKYLSVRDAAGRMPRTLWQTLMQ
jgi:hypothetical protein